MFFSEDEGPCSPSFWIGDGFCDDHLNNFQCGFDGDDCCLTDAQQDFCQICACIGKEGIQIYTTILPPPVIEISIPVPVLPPGIPIIPMEPNWLLPGRETEERN